MPFTNKKELLVTYTIKKGDFKNIIVRVKKLDLNELREIRKEIASREKVEDPLDVIIFNVVRL